MGAQPRFDYFPLTLPTACLECSGAPHRSPYSSHTCAIEWVPVGSSPAHLRSRDPSGSTTQQYCTSQRGLDAGHPRTELWALALPQLQLAKGHSSQIKWGGTPQSGLDEDQVWDPTIQEMDQVIQLAVTHPRVVLQPCSSEREGKRWALDSQVPGPSSFAHQRG